MPHLKAGQNFILGTATDGTWMIPFTFHHTGSERDFRANMNQVKGVLLGVHPPFLLPLFNQKPSLLKYLGK